jgi:hypothetical protein
MSFILIVDLIGFAYFQVTSIVSNIPYPIRIVQLYNRFVISLTLFMQNSAKYGLIYTIIGIHLWYRPFMNYINTIVNNCWFSELVLS